MEKANQEFNNYCKCLTGESTEDKATALVRYQLARNAVTKESYTKEHKRWESLIRDHDSKKLWENIDWKGGMCKNQIQNPMTEDLAVYFENLY